MKKYRREISFKTLFLTCVRRIDLFLITLLIGVIGTVVASQFIMKQKYYSTASFYRYDSVIKEPLYEKIKEYVLSENTISITAKELVKNKIYHANGDVITEQEITDGLTVEQLAINSVTVDIKFESADKSIVKDVLYSVSYVTIDCINVGGDTSVTGTKVKTEASEPMKDNKNNKTLVVGLLSSLAISLVLAFVSEVVLDEVYDSDDISLMGAKAFETKFLKDKGNSISFTLVNDERKTLVKNANKILEISNNKVVFDDFVKFQNNLSANFKTKSVIVVSIDDDFLTALFSTVLAKTYSSYKKTSALIDFNFYDSKTDEVIKNSDKLGEVSISQTEFKFKNIDDFAKCLKVKGDICPSDYFISKESLDVIKKVTNDVQNTIVIGPAIGSHEDSTLLSKNLDCLLIVVQRNATTKSKIYKTISLLKEKGISNFAFVIVK